MNDQNATSNAPIQMGPFTKEFFECYGQDWRNINQQMFTDALMFSTGADKSDAGSMALFNLLLTRMLDELHACYAQHAATQRPVANM